MYIISEVSFLSFFFLSLLLLPHQLSWVNNKSESERVDSRTINTCSAILWRRRPSYDVVVSFFLFMDDGERKKRILMVIPEIIENDIVAGPKKCEREIYFFFIIIFA